MNTEKVVGGVGLKEPERRSWNTANLGRRMGADAMSAGIAGGLVAPIICAIDKYGSMAFDSCPGIIKLTTSTEL